MKYFFSFFLLAIPIAALGASGCDDTNPPTCTTSTAAENIVLHASALTPSALPEPGQEMEGFVAGIIHDYKSALRKPLYANAFCAGYNMSVKNQGYNIKYYEQMVKSSLTANDIVSDTAKTILAGIHEYVETPAIRGKITIYSEKDGQIELSCPQ